MNSNRRSKAESGARTDRLCERLLQKWDPMFSESVDPTRGHRTDAILEGLGARFQGRFQVLDLGTGPGRLRPGCSSASRSVEWSHWTRTPSSFG